MASYGFKISAEKRKELVDLYMAVGMKGVAKKAQEYGVSVKYVMNAASAMGVGRGRNLRSDADPRWARARAIGVVVA